MLTNASQTNAQHAEKNCEMQNGHRGPVKGKDTIHVFSGHSKTIVAVIKIKVHEINMLQMIDG